MLSGAILGDCPTCDEIVWEDQPYECLIFNQKILCG